MRIDLGGIGVGFAIDEAMRELSARGIQSALLDGSGDIAVSGPPPGESGWKIALAEPGRPDGPPWRTLLLAHRAITTSGDAFQFIELNGVRYSHIVDPSTGLGMTDQRTVVVVAPDCTAADSLATALSVMPPEAGLRLAAETAGVEVRIVRRSQSGGTEEFCSAGFAAIPTAD
jgi:thiamine biosynthesis lipoprotein